MTIGEKIRARRTELGLTQEALARKIGTIKQTIYKYETGIICAIPMERKLALAQALELAPAELADSAEEALLLTPERSLSGEDRRILTAFRQADDATRQAILQLLCKP